ncbi:type I pullulanase [Helcococcus bovis]|uniref:type I pullulanase n=1 Tax=Helcococcus bovis TaxID=3153252 RepID=UPI0038BDD70B
MKTETKTIFRKTIAILLAFMISLSGVNVQGFMTKTVEAQEQYIDFGFTKSGEKEDFGAKAKVNSNKTVDFVFDFEHWKDGFQNQAKIRGVNGDWDNGKDLLVNKSKNEYTISLSFEEVKSLKDGGFKIFLPDIAQWRPQTSGNAKIPQSVFDEMAKIEQENTENQSGETTPSEPGNTTPDKPQPPIEDTTPREKQGYKYTIHFKKEDEEKNPWNEIHVWGNNLEGKRYYFGEPDAEGYKTVDIENLPVSELKLITKPFLGEDWKDQESDRVINIPTDKKEVEVWILQGNNKVYYQKPNFNVGADSKVKLNASLHQNDVKAGDSALLKLNIKKDDNVEITQLYVIPKGLEIGKIDISKNLQEQSIEIPLNAIGVKDLDVYAVDKEGNIYKETVKLNILPSDNKTAWDEEIIYFMVTDRFFDGNKSNSKLNGEESYDLNHLEAYHGGDFKGITEKVEYLKNLGVSTVWITPIVDNINDNLRKDKNDKQYGYHGYWAYDFTKLDPTLGTEAEFKEMIDTLHKNGIKVMVDIVLNHAGYGAEKNTDFKGMFRETETEGDITTKLSGLPDFKTEDPDVSKKLVEWQTNWIKNYEIDYFRIDTVKHVEHETWKELKNSVVKVKPGFKMIGEFYDGKFDFDGGYLGKGQMDSILDFEFKHIADNFVHGKLLDAERRLEDRNNSLSTVKTLGQFLSSHDEDGFLATKVNGNVDLLKVAASLQMTAKGQPVIYYGEEIGLSGKNAKNMDNGEYGENRKSFDWDKINNNPLLEHYKKITNIRKDHSAVFARGDRKNVISNDKYSVFTRKYDNKTAIVGLNITDQEQKVNLTLEGVSSIKDLYSEKEYAVNNGKVTVTIPANKDGGTAIFLLDQNITPKAETTKVVFHFDNYNKEKWSLWVWANGANGKEYSFDGTDNFGQTVTIDLGTQTDQIGYIVKSPNTWDRKNVDANRYVKIDKETTHVWIRDEDPQTYLEEPKNIAEESPVIQSFTIDRYREINLRLNKYVNFEDVKQDYELKFGNEDIKSKVEKIESVDQKGDNTRKIKIILKEDINLDEIISKGKDVSIVLKVKDIDQVKEEELTAKATIGRIVSEKQFDEKYATDEELGAIYSEGLTEFKVWAPTAKKVELVTYHKDGASKVYDMTRNEKGVYSHKLEGNQLGLEYMYKVYLSDSEGVEVVDPYAKSVTVNGERGVVVNPTPSEVSRPVNEANMKNPIIYELHVRDFSIAENSGMTNKGKFLALTEKGTKADNGQITGLDYLKSLGVTHIQLLPIYDFSSRSVDENNIKAKYNWGYDPQNYNAVEGSYSTDPKDPFNRIEELQKTVDTLHENGLGVIMDVVYNHVFDTQEQSFNKIVPGYYFRMKEDGTFHSGTGVGNETASERKMMRKFMVDSTKHWVKTFKLDGLRFDLMGTHDYETMNAVYNAVKEINPNIFILGEGWNMDMGIPKEQRASQINADKMPNIAFFSDDMRNALKGGSDDASTGFISGAPDKEEAIIKNIKGGQGLDKPYQSARQVVQYVAAHDNLTLWDKLQKSRSDDNVETRVKRQNLANAITMFSFGTPFVHAGQEFGRTKGGNHNSYNSPDEVNQFDWNRVKDFSNMTDYFRELVKIRKNNEIFNKKDFNEINKFFEIKHQKYGEVGYKLERGDSDLYIGHNVSDKVVPFEVETGRYRVLVMNNQAKAEGLREIDIKDSIKLSPLSTIVLQKIPTKEKTFTIHFDNPKAKEEGYKVHFFTNNDQGITLEFDGVDENKYSTATYKTSDLVTRAGFIIYKGDKPMDDNKVGTKNDRILIAENGSIAELDAWVKDKDEITYYNLPAYLIEDNAIKKENNPTPDDEQLGEIPTPNRDGEIGERPDPNENGEAGKTPNKQKTAVLTFDLSGGNYNGRTGGIIVKAKVGDTINLPEAPTKEGFVFDYWKGSKYEAGAKYLVEGPHKFTAIWKKVEEKPINAGTITKSNNGQNSTQNGNPETGDFGVSKFAIMIVISMGVILVVRKKRI